MLCSYDDKISRPSNNGTAEIPELQLVEYTFLQPRCTEEVGNTSGNATNASNFMKEVEGVVNGEGNNPVSEQGKDAQLLSGSFIIDENNNMVIQNRWNESPPDRQYYCGRNTKSVHELTSDLVDVKYSSVSSKSEVCISSNSNVEKDNESMDHVLWKSVKVKEKLVIKFRKYEHSWHEIDLDLDSASVCKSTVIPHENLDSESHKFKDELKKLPVKPKSKIISDYLDQLQKPKGVKDFANLLKEPELLPLKVQLTEFVKVRKPRYQFGDVVVLKEDPFSDYLIKFVASWKKCCYHVQQVTGPGGVFKWIADEEVMKKKRRVPAKGPGMTEIYVIDASVQADILVKEHFDLLIFIRSRDFENQESESYPGQFGRHYDENYEQPTQPSNNWCSVSKKARPVRVPLISDVIKVDKSCQTDENVKLWREIFNDDSAPSSLCSSLDEGLVAPRIVAVQNY